MILYNDFPRFIKIEWAASDTETFTYIDGVKVSEDDLQILGKEKPAKFFREHATVRVWAWQISDGEHFFATNDFDEYINFIGEHKIKAVWFYNAKFDFAQIDYQILTHVPPYARVTDDDKCNSPWRYSSLHNDKGGRFSLKLWTPYKASGAGSRNVDRHEHTHAVVFYDFCNIFGGGLKRLLEEFNVVDFSGNEIRKSTMNYQAVDESALSTDELQYLKNDTGGLYHLIRIASATLEDLTGYTITKAKPDIMTAGGLAKKMLLKHLYPDAGEHERKRKFQRDHPLTLAQDIYAREHKLYAGGVCILNDKFAGVLQRGIKMRRYDVNSEYPYAMSIMQDIVGKAHTMTLSAWKKQTKAYKHEHIAIYIIEEIEGVCKADKVPCFRQPFTGKYTAEFHVEERILMFEREYEELAKWYDFDDCISGVIVYKTRQNPKYAEFVYEYYKLKNDSKKAGEKAKTAFAKLLLNSSYGKLAERVQREITYREINEESGAVHLVHTIEDEIDEKSMLNVIQGALITSIARVYILSHIREICHENVRDNFIYCDTDSIHTLCEYDAADAVSLGGFKDESPPDGFNCVKYIAPKCYFDAVVDHDGEIEFIEFHSKGLSIKVIENEFKNADGKFKNISYIDKRFSYGEKFQPLSGMNIRGGKALIPIEKYLAKPLKNVQYINGMYMDE